jgi:hypothetical protein
VTIRYFRRQTAAPFGESQCQPREIKTRKGMAVWLGSRCKDVPVLLARLDAEAARDGKSSIYKTPAADYWAESDAPPQADPQLALDSGPNRSIMEGSR